MYAEVVVLTYQAPNINYFTYKIPANLEKQIKLGQLVEVPFGKRNPRGIIVALHKEKPPKTRTVLVKEISSIIFPHPLLLPFQIELLKWMAAYYFAPTVNCLEAMLPKIPAREIISEEAFLQSGLSIGQRPRTFGGLQGRLIASKKVDERKQIQTIVLVPTINRLPETLAQFPNAKNYLIYHNELKPKEKFEAWQKIISADYDYIFGSRSAIFTPCPNLEEIIIYDDHDGAYKDERSPYFDTLTVAEKIAELTGAKLKIIDTSPKVTTYSNHQKELQVPKIKTDCKIISLEEERLAGNKTPVSGYLEELLKKLKPQNKTALLFVNKKKESGHVYCRNCKTNQFIDKEPEQCPVCGSLEIYFSSLNIYSLEKLIAKLIPNSKINIIADKFKTANISDSKVDIATSLIFYLAYTKKYDLTAYILADSLLSVADFTTGEKIFEQITNLKKLTKPSGKLIIQTFNPQNSQIQNAADGNYQNFITEELKLRKLLFYPPFGLLIKLTLKGKSGDKVQKEAESTAANLRSATSNQRLTINGPYSPIFSRQKAPKCNIILKYKLENYSLTERQKAIKAIYPLLYKLKGWQITVEPESIN